MIARRLNYFTANKKRESWKTYQSQQLVLFSTTEATRQVLMRGVTILWLSFFLVPTSAFVGHTAPVTVIIPIEEVEFEAPALPPPLWRTNFLVMKELALMQVETFKEKEAEAAQQLQRMPRISSVVLNYERVDGHFGRVTSSAGELQPRISRDIEYDGNIVSASFKLVWDMDKFSFGGLIPYDNLNLDSFDADRIGAIIFGEYELSLNEVLTMGFALNGIYVYNGINSNINNITFKDFHTFGTNISVSLTMDTKDIYRGISVTKPEFSLVSFAGSIAFSYQFSTDNVDRMGVENERVVKEVDNQN
jgi:hypothetical protein